MKTKEIFIDQALPNARYIKAARRLSEKYDCKLTLHFKEMSIVADRGFFKGEVSELKQ